MGKRVNTTVKERKALLKELGYTEEEMANFYNEAAEVNPTIKSLVAAGYKWTDLAVHQMRQLPGLKERTLQILAEKEAKIKADKEKAEQAEQNRKYYIEHFEELMLEKIDNKEELTKSELEKLVIRDEICTTYGDNRRWSRVASTIVKIQDRTFEIEWDEGLTESQPNMFDSQPVEVEKHVYHELVERVQWVKKGEHCKNSNKECTMETIVDKITEYMYCNFGDFKLNEMNWDQLTAAREEIKQSIITEYNNNK